MVKRIALVLALLIHGLAVPHHAGAAPLRSTAVEHPAADPPPTPEQVWTQTVNAIADRDQITIEQATLNLVSMLTPGYIHANPQVQQWHDLALEAGWSEAQWPHLACIMQRESGGDPAAYNGRDPGYGSFGLLMVNMGKGRWGTWAVYRGILSQNMDALFDPGVNLAVARDLFARSQRAYRGDGWRPWATRRRSC